MVRDAPTQLLYRQEPGAVAVSKPHRFRKMLKLFLVILALYVLGLLFLYVVNGVTTVRGMQGDRSQFTTRDQIARGETLGPRLFLGSTAMHGARVTTPEQAEQFWTW